jgi:hypothetical protein
MRFKSMLCAGALSLTGACALWQMDGPMTPVGLIYAEVTGPGRYYEIEQGMGPGSKTGKSEAQSILGLVATGDNSVEKAASNGGIKKIYTIDWKVFNVLGVYAKFETHVTGE